MATVSLSRTTCATWSGANEVYARPFPATAGGRWQVSTGGGNGPALAAPSILILGR